MPGIENGDNNGNDSSKKRKISAQESPYSEQKNKAPQRLIEGGKGPRVLRKEQERIDLLNARQKRNEELNIEPGVTFEFRGEIYNVEKILPDSKLVQCYLFRTNNIRVVRSIDPLRIERIVSRPRKPE